MATTGAPRASKQPPQHHHTAFTGFAGQVAYTRRYPVPPHLDLLGPEVRLREAAALEAHWKGSADTLAGVPFRQLPARWWTGWTAGRPGALRFRMVLPSGEVATFRQGPPALPHRRADKLGLNTFAVLDFVATDSTGAEWTARVAGPAL